MASTKQEDPLSETHKPFSPGAMRLSDLGPPASDTPPRRLEPLKTRKKKRKRPAKAPPPGSSQPISDRPLELMNQSMLSQLRARLEEVKDTPLTPSPPSSPSTARNKTSTTPLKVSHASLSQDLRVSSTTEEHSEEEKRRQIRKKRRAKDPMERTGSRNLLIPQLVISNEGEGESEESPLPDMTRPQEDTPRSSGPETGRRRLPEFPMDPDSHIEFPIESVAAANHPLSSTLPFNQKTEGVLHLLSHDDVIEVVKDKDDLGDSRLQYTLLSSQPNPCPSRSKDLIYMERRDGKGFVARRRDDARREAGLETAPPKFSNEITGIDLALLVHKFLQRLALLAHGLITGLSLWECIVLNLLSRQPTRHVNLLDHYHPLTLPSHALHFLLLSIVLLSLLDRLDFSHINKTFLQNFIRDPSQVILIAVGILVTLALVVTLSLISIEDRIALFPQEASLWSDIYVPPLPPLPANINNNVTRPTLPSQVTFEISFSRTSTDGVSDRVTPFLALTIVRAACCCISWFAIIWLTNYDRLQDYLANVVGGLTRRRANHNIMV